MDSAVPAKRRKTEPPDSSPKQVDAHIRAFLNAVISKARNPSSSSSIASSSIASAVSKALVKRKKNVPRADAATQTEDEDFMEPYVAPIQRPPSATTLLSENAAAYYANSDLTSFPPAPSNTDLHYFTTGSNSRISSAQVRTLLSSWMRDYQQWFYQNFGVDVNSVPNEPIPAPPESAPQIQQALIDLDTGRAVASQTPFQTTSQPIVYSAQPVIYNTPAVNPLNSLLSSQMANAQSLLNAYVIAQQQQLMAAAAAASMAALANPMICVPPRAGPAVPAEPQIDPGEMESMTASIPVTQYAAYGIIRPCPLDVMETQDFGPNTNGSGDSQELPVYITAVDYRDQRQTWMPPIPPKALLMMKQTLVCQLQICVSRKAHEIDVRKITATKTPVEIDYVAALETTVERFAKSKVVYVFSRVNRLPLAARKHYFSVDSPVTESSGPSSGSGAQDSTSNSLEPRASVVVGCEPSTSTFPEAESLTNFLDVERVEGELQEGVSVGEEEEVGVDAACEERIGKMYICDLLIGDIFICQALADYKLQAKSCAARNAISLLSKPKFLVGAVRTWYESDEEGDGKDFLSLCVSPRADGVPQLPPFLADPLAPIASEQSVSPGDPAETQRVCNPKPLHDLWLYTALPIVLDPCQKLTTEQYLAQSAEFSQMTVNIEVEYEPVAPEARGETVFTAYGLVDGQRCSRATATSLSLSRAAATTRLLRRLRFTQPVVGLLLPPPDPTEDEEDQTAGLSVAQPEDSMHPLWGLSEASIVESLMWGKNEKQFALPIEHLEAHCEIFGSTNGGEPADPEFSEAGSNFFLSRAHLERYLEAYAASALVTPLRISLSVLPQRLWAAARSAAHEWGLLTRSECEVPDSLHTAFLLVCKRVPLPRLKRSLLDRNEVGVFYLVSRGALPPAALQALAQADLLDDDRPQEEEEQENQPVFPPMTVAASPSPPDTSPNDPLTRMARTFHATALEVKAEPKETPTEKGEEEEEVGAVADVQLVTAELNQPSNAVEILDDLPRQLIPGIDF